MPSLPVPSGRSSQRSSSKTRASLITGLKTNPKRCPCLVLDSSKDGFRLRGSFHLHRGQVVEIILDDDPGSPVRCSVIWVGRPGSKHEGEAGLQTV
jgi:hypothetical protein